MFKHVRNPLCWVRRGGAPEFRTMVASGRLVVLSSTLRLPAGVPGAAGASKERARMNPMLEDEPLCRLAMRENQIADLQAANAKLRLAEPGA
jgi:hypothetical protein